MGLRIRAKRNPTVLKQLFFSKKALKIAQRLGAKPPDPRQ